MKKMIILALITVLIALTVTGAVMHSRKDIKHPVRLKVKAENEVVFKVRVLESGTVTYVTLSKKEARVLRSGDIIWLDTRTHTINDESVWTLKAKLIRTLK
jgi:hypothetical protein